MTNATSLANTLMLDHSLPTVGGPVPLIAEATTPEILWARVYDGTEANIGWTPNDRESGTTVVFPLNDTRLRTTDAFGRGFHVGAGEMIAMVTGQYWQFRSLKPEALYAVVKFVHRPGEGGNPVSTEAGFISHHEVHYLPESRAELLRWTDSCGYLSHYSYQRQTLYICTHGCFMATADGQDPRRLDAGGRLLVTGDTTFRLTPVSNPRDFRPSVIRIELG